MKFKLLITILFFASILRGQNNNTPKEYQSVEAYNFAQKCAALKDKERALQAEKDALQYEVTRFEKMQYEADFKAFQQLTAQLDYEYALEMAKVKKRYDDMKAAAAVKFSVTWSRPVTEKMKCD